MLDEVEGRNQTGRRGKMRLKRGCRDEVKLQDETRDEEGEKKC